jgi:hypothetical protein
MKLFCQVMDVIAGLPFGLDGMNVDATLMLFVQMALSNA